MGNYRPKSLLPLPGKLLEKVMYMHIMDRLESEKILNYKHREFRKGFSATKPISNLTNNILSGVNEGG